MWPYWVTRRYWLILPARSQRAATVTIGASQLTVGDVISQINSAGLKITASINAQGDGIQLTDTSSPAGAQKILVEDKSGLVAKGLNLAGEAAGTGAANKIDGSYERVVSLLATDSLSAVVTKINSANAGVSASIVSDGSTAAPYRLNLSASATGSAGKFLIDTNGLDLGLTTLQSGQDARVFFGTGDPATGLLLSSSSNTIDNAVQGLTLNLLSVKSTPVTVTVARDSSVVEGKIKDFISSYNDMIDTINAQSSYDADTKKAGPLLGDGTTLTLRQSMAGTIQASPIGVVPRFLSAVEVGVKVGKDGKLEFSTDKFRAALAQDPDSVEKLLFARTQTNVGGTRDLGGGVTVNDPDQAAQFSELGVFTQMEELATRYIDSTRGILTGKDKSITAMTEAISKQMSALDDRISSKRQVLQAKFLVMEQTIGKLQGQQSALSSMGG